MGNVSVSNGATAKLGNGGGDIKVGHAARIEPEDKVIQVTGRVFCDGDAEFQGSLSCSEFSARHGKSRVEGDLNSRGEVRVDDGQLAIDGSLEATVVTVDKALRVGGNARADDFDVGGVLEVRGTISGRKVDVGGSFKVQGTAEVDEVDVGGTVDIAGLVKSSKLDIGGRAYIGAELRLDSLDVGGSMEADQIIAQKSIEVGGDLKTIKGTKGDTVELGHGSRASGPIVAREVSVGHGGRVEDVYADTLEMEQGSRARNLYFREGVIEAGVHVEGEVLYTDTIEASPDVKFAKPASKVNDLPKPPL